MNIWGACAALAAVVRGYSYKSPPVSPSEKPKLVRQVNDSLYELHKPEGTPSMRIVFFHGLQLANYSDAHLSTWKSADGSSIWPRDWLAEDFPQAHIFTVSYNNEVSMFLFEENLTADLMMAVGQVPYCPVILVGHSVGGLVIKKICLNLVRRLYSGTISHAEREKLGTFLDNLRGIFYYGTPHRGSSLIDRVGNGPLFNYFKLLNQEAARMNFKFDDLMRLYPKLKVVGIGERLPTSSGSFRRIVVVPEASSRESDEFNVVAADHFSVCQPRSRVDRRFYAFKDFLDEVASTVDEEAMVRGEPCPQNFQHLPRHLISIDADIKKIIRKLDTAMILGLTGIGGLGKTTIAMAVFNGLVSRFEYSCFVPQVKFISGCEDNVKDAMWDKMYCRGKKVEGRRNWSRLQGQKLLLVLDDISYREMRVLLDLANDVARESRFIVTSRDQGLLGSLGEVYVVPLRDEGSATMLFKKHAFPNQEMPPKELEHVMESIILMCDGLPLTLQTVGLYLRSTRNHEVWEQTLIALAKAEDVRGLNERLWAPLKSSYDDLTSTEQEMFLDASTFFCNGPWTLREANAAIGAAYGRHGSLLWRTLVERSLVYDVEEDERIQLQQQLQHLGQRIASEPSNYDKVRVWNGEVGLKILQTTNDELEGKEIHALRVGQLPRECIHLTEAALSKLKKVRFLEVNAGVIVDGATEGVSVPREVVLLKCIGQGLFNPALQTRLAVLKVSDINYLPPSIGQLSRLEYMEIDRSNLESLPTSFGQLSSLKTLRFSYCDRLRRLPGSFGQLSALETLEFYYCDSLRILPGSFVELCALNSLSFCGSNKLQTLPKAFGQLSSLETLGFSYCHSLRSFPESFGKLSALKFLQFSCCDSLRSFPQSFGQLSSLETLKFSYCDSLHSLPESFGQLSALKTLELSYCTSLRSLPGSFGQLHALNSLSFCDCKKLQTLPESFGKLRALETLEFSYCDSLRSLPQSFGELSSLKSLEFSDCDSLRSLPKSFGQLSALNSLSFWRCNELQSLPESFGALSSLETLTFSCCDRLRRLPESFGQLFALKTLEFSYCDSLCSFPESFALVSASKTLEFLKLPESLKDWSDLKFSAVEKARRASKSLAVDQERLNNYEVQGLETAGPVSRSVCMEDFRKNVEEGGEDGYFVSNTWLVSLEEHERSSLMSTLWGAGYSAIDQTATTTLFARVENDVRFEVAGNDVSSTFAKNGMTARDKKADAEDVLSPVEIGEAKEQTDEYPSDEVLRNGIRELLRDPSRLDCRKVTFQGIVAQLEEKFKVDISAKMYHVKSLILQEASTLTEGALTAETPIFKDQAEALEVDTAKQSDEGISTDHLKKFLEEQMSPVVDSLMGVALDKQFEGDPAPEGMETEQSLTLQSMEQKMASKTPSASIISNSYPLEQQAATWRTFKAAIQNNWHHSFCVSTHWVSKLQDNEKGALALICLQAGYEMTYQTSTTTWYKRIYGNLENQSACGGCDNDPSTSLDVSGSDVKKPGTPGSGSLDGNTNENVDRTDTTTGSSDPTLKKATSRIPFKNCTCRPQTLTVTCSSPGKTPVDVPQPRGKLIKQKKFDDDLVVTMPKKVGSKKIEATIHKPHPITAVDFRSNQTSTVKLVATARTSLSCCLDKDHHKIRIKVSTIYGEVKTNDQTCNGTVLSTVCTNLFVRRIDDEDNEDAWEEISLTLEDEGYRNSQYRQVLESAGDPRNPLDDLVWLKLSNIIPAGCDFEGITIELAGDFEKRRKVDLDQEVRRAHILRFQDIHAEDSVIFKGDVDIVRYSTSKLELQIRQQLEISYYEPCIRMTRGNAVWSGRGTGETIDFNCSLDIRIEEFDFA